MTTDANWTGATPLSLENPQAKLENGSQVKLFGIRRALLINPDSTEPQAYGGI